jgi:ring-1,2-phenylacetyl-CoA epoxidase subunit PaaD
MSAALEVIRDVVGGVPDPEIPAVSIADLGILRDVRVDAGGRVEVTITPTYSGCPAMDTIREEIAAACGRHGWHDVTVHTVLSPAWTTDWLTEDGKRKLRRAGISPPSRAGPVPVSLSVPCTRCGSADTREISRFGSTACKALYACNSCREPFEHFKAL